MKELRIQSYFSLPTDLAGEMREWPQFVSGEGYSVELRDSDTNEVVTVRLVEDNGGNDYVVVQSTAPGPLFDRTVGRVIDALSHHSDNLLVYRRG